MLATEDKTNILLWNTTKNLEYYPKPFKQYNGYQHLYITSDEEIKEGGWYYYPNILGASGIQQCESKEHLEELVTTKYKGFRKIIASTDSNLHLPIYNDGKADIELPLSQLPQQFLEMFCKKGGISEVEVEFGRTMDGTPTYNKLKVNPDNTINIREIKEKVYSKVDLETKLFELAEHYAMTSSKGEIDDFNEWIKINL